MSIFDKTGQGAMGGVAYAQEMEVPQALTPREMHLKERVMSHEQRLSLVEEENRNLRDSILQLAAACRTQLGLEI